MKIYLFTIPFFIAISILAGCTAGDKSTSNETALFNTWIADSINGIKTDANIYKDKFPTLIFKEANDVSGTTGCNTINGKYTVSGSTIKISDMISTKMFCDDIDETTFLSILKNADSYKIQNEKLYLYSGKDIKMVLKKEK
ncbi:MAG: META domain-containing protein [Ignavibacteriae bacterium]|nr:MAG: META domain-containing protein [Ignavibacteriota bacterium]